MAGIRLFDVHRTWEDWTGILLGVLIGLSPWLIGEMGALPDWNEPLVTHPAAWNAVLVGALVIALGAMELSGLQRWEEGLEILCGLWLAASPFIFGYGNAGTLRYWHFVLAAVVVLLALLELWQDWKLSDKELARHGQ